ncbi:MAG TPA: DUF4350 domain-containing protein [Candidatus Baltobacteraceae bacterium]
MKRGLELAAIVAGIALVIAIALARQAELAAVKPSYFSSYDSGRNGYRALYDVLSRDGVTVRRFERDLGLLDRDTGVLVVSPSDLEAGFSGRTGQRYASIGPSDLLRLRAFARGGGRLVVLDTAFGGADDALLGLPGTHDIKPATVALALTAGPSTAGVSRVRASVGAVFGWAVPKAEPLLGVAGGTVAIAYPLGKGEVVAIAAPDVLSNAHVAQADNARFAFDVLAGHGVVAFDERLHGYAQDKSFWSALPAPVHAAVWIVLGIVVLALVGANVRFAPALPVDPPGDRDSSDYLASMGALLRRARAARGAIAAFAEDAFRRARRRYGLSGQADVSAIVARIQSEEMRRAIANLDRLRAIERPSDAALVRAANLCARLRKELG